MTELTTSPIKADELVKSVPSANAGAIVTFLGVTREFTNGRQTRCLDYEAYSKMAHQELQKLENTARDRWRLTDCHIVHRLGRVELAEPSVAIVVAAEHRKEAFEACEWLIDTLKQRVPIWKQEHWADGSTEWVHPGQ